jgi:transposase
MDNANLAHQFCQAATQLGLRGKRKQYPQQLQQLALSHFQLRTEQGASLGQIAKELRLSYGCLQRWVNAATPSSFRLIELVQPPVAVSPSLLIVSGPAGLRVEGLSLDDLSVLWRSLL